MPVLNDFTEEFLNEEMVAITGPSGRGKSTLLYLLGLMTKPQKGNIYIDGLNVSGLNDWQRSQYRANEFGFVFQDAALDSTRSVLDNVLEPSLYRGDERRFAAPSAIDLLEKFGVGLRASAKPTQVSGGQAQRIALCRALLSNPGVVLADEPTGNLDSESAELVIGALREHARSGATVIIVTHDKQVVNECDREIML